MKKVMHSIHVETDKNSDIVISQKWNDMNEPDPEITVSKEQAGLVASWIIEAVQESEGSSENTESIPVDFWCGNPGADHENLQIYNNDKGMVILKLNEDTFIEVSPIMAKRMRDQLSKAITVSFTDMLRSDDDV